MSDASSRRASGGRIAHCSPFGWQAGGSRSAAREAGDGARRASRAAVVAIVGVAAPAGLLRWLGTDQLVALTAGHATIDAVVGAAALLGVWALLSWLAAAVLVSVAATLPGRCGDLAGRYAARVAPRLVRRLVALLVGVTVVGAGAAPALAAAPASTGAVLAVGPSIAAAQPVWRRPSASSSTGGLLAWHAPRALADLAQLPSLDRSTSRAASSSRVPADQALLPSLDRPWSAAVVVVAPGDCLWAIAARHLGPAATTAEIATEWPRWYDANRSVIGADPDLILPGQRLVPPD